MLKRMRAILRSTRSTVRLTALVAVLGANGCAPYLVGRVVSDVRIAHGWISVDRCQIKQVPFHGYEVTDCQTANYYVGAGAMPVRTTLGPTATRPVVLTPSK